MFQKVREKLAAYYTTLQMIVVSAKEKITLLNISSKELNTTTQNNTITKSTKSTFPSIQYFKLVNGEDIVAISKYDDETRCYKLNYPIRVVAMMSDQGVDYGFASWAMEETWQEVNLSDRHVISKFPCGISFVKQYTYCVEQLQKNMVENFKKQHEAEFPKHANGDVILH